MAKKTITPSKPKKEGKRGPRSRTMLQVRFTEKDEWQDLEWFASMPDARIAARAIRTVVNTFDEDAQKAMQFSLRKEYAGTSIF